MKDENAVKRGKMRTERLRNSKDMKLFCDSKSSKKQEPKKSIMNSKPNRLLC